MEPIQIYDPVKNSHFEVFVTNEVAERCRSDSSFAEDLYCQIRDQAIEEGSTIEIQAEVIEDSKNIDVNDILEEDFSKDTTKLWSKNEVTRLIKFYGILRTKVPINTSSSAFWNRISKELAKKHVQKTADQCKQKWKNLKKSYKSAIEKPDRSRFLFFHEIDCVIKGIPAPFTDDSEDEIDEEDPDWDTEQLIDNKESWSRKETLTFLNIYLENQDLRHEYKTSIDFFNLLSGELAKHGINKAPEKCSNKWKNLLRTYKRLSSKNNRHSVRFPYYSEVNKIMNSRKSNSDDDMIIDVSDIEDSTEILNTEEIIILTGDENKENASHTVKDCGNKTEENVQKKLNWQEDEISALIRAYKRYKDSYNNYSVKRQFWAIIANVLDEEGFPGRDADKCKDKWRNLMHTYENYLNKNDPNFTFGTALDDIFKTDNNDANQHSEHEIIIFDNIDGDNDSDQMEIEENKEKLKTKPSSQESWTYEEMFALIESFQKYSNGHSLNPGNNLLWTQVSTYLQTKSITRSPEDCKNQWNNLYDMYVAHKELNLNNTGFPFANIMDSIFGNENEDDILDDLSMNNGTTICKCKERVLAVKHKRHRQRMELLKRKLSIEERKVKAFEEYVNCLKKSV